MTNAAIQTVTLQRQDVLFRHGDTVQPSRNQKDLTAETRRTRRSSLGAHASRKTPKRLFSVVNKVLEFFSILASRNSSGCDGFGKRFF